jgi:4'-phosphopantetheinyl transferase
MSRQEIKVFYTPSVLNFASRLSEYQALLDQDELAIAERFKHSDLKIRYIICHGILRQLLAKHLNQSAADLDIEKTEFGKPFLPDHPDTSFNMSHSGDSLAVAISSQYQLGIDVERYKSRHSWQGLVKKCFAPEEADYWYSLDKTERSHAFYQFWVKKEAFVKAVGKGITLGLDQCVVNPEDTTSFLRIPELGGLADQWQIYTLDLPEDEFGAVVCNQRNVILQLIAIS